MDDKIIITSLRNELRCKMIDYNNLHAENSILKIGVFAEFIIIVMLSIINYSH